MILKPPKELNLGSWSIDAQIGFLPHHYGRRTVYKNRYFILYIFSLSLTHKEFWWFQLIGDSTLLMDDARCLDNFRWGWCSGYIG